MVAETEELVDTCAVLFLGGTDKPAWTLEGRGGQGTACASSQSGRRGGRPARFPVGKTTLSSPCSVYFSVSDKASRAGRT